MDPLDLHIPADHPAFDGHFTGQPLLPGVSLVAEVLEAALMQPELAAVLGETPRIGAVKFLSPVRPDTRLALQFDASASALRFEVRAAERLVASGHFERAAP